MIIGSPARAPLEGRWCQGCLIYPHAPANRCGCLCGNLVVGDGSGEVTVQLLCMTLGWWIPTSGKGIVFILHNISFPISNGLRKQTPHSLILQTLRLQNLENWIWAMKIYLLGCRNFPSWDHRLISPARKLRWWPCTPGNVAKALWAPGAFLPGSGGWLKGAHGLTMAIPLLLLSTHVSTNEHFQMHLQQCSQMGCAEWNALLCLLSCYLTSRAFK